MKRTERFVDASCRNLTDDQSSEQFVALGMIADEEDLLRATSMTDTCGDRRCSGLICPTLVSAVRAFLFAAQ